MPALSVIIPVYNCEKYLTETVQSVIKQSCEDLEIIIVNDGSTDESGQLADELAKHYDNIRVFHTSNKGVSHARNVGIENAKGKYLSFLDADDVWCRNAYTSAIQEKLVCEKYDIVSFGYFVTDEELKFGDAQPEENGLIERNDSHYNYIAKCRHFSAYFYKRELFENVRFPEGVRYGEDTAFLFLITRRASSILRVNNYLFMYRTNPNSVMNKTINFDYALDVINGLYMVKQNLLNESERLECDEAIYKMMYNYLTLSSKNGAFYKKLYSDMMKCKAFQEAADNVEKNHVNEEVISFIKQFKMEPQKTCKELRKKGFLRYTVRKIIRKTILRKVVLKVRFKTPLKDYVC